MNLSVFGSLFAQMYTDKMSISRYTETENTDGTTSVSKNLEPVYTDIPCRISFNQNDNPESLADDANPIFIQIKLFCKADVDIKKGDGIMVNRLDSDGSVLATYKGVSNLPIVYTTHKEIQIVQSGDA